MQQTTQRSTHERSDEIVLIPISKMPQQEEVFLRVRKDITKSLKTFSLESSATFLARLFDLPASLTWRFLPNAKNKSPDPENIAYLDIKKAIEILAQNLSSQAKGSPSILPEELRFFVSPGERNKFDLDVLAKTGLLPDKKYLDRIIEQGLKQELDTFSSKKTQSLLEAEKIHTSLARVFRSLEREQKIKLRFHILNQISEVNKISVLETCLTLWPHLSKETVKCLFNEDPKTLLAGISRLKIFTTLRFIPKFPFEFLAAFASDQDTDLSLSFYKAVTLAYGIDKTKELSTRVSELIACIRSGKKYPIIDPQELIFSKGIVIKTIDHSADQLEEKIEREKNIVAEPLEDQLKIKLASNLKTLYENLDANIGIKIRNDLIIQIASSNLISPKEVCAILWPFMSKSAIGCLLNESDKIKLRGLSDKKILSVLAKLPRIPLEYLLAFSALTDSEKQTRLFRCIVDSFGLERGKDLFIKAQALIAVFSSNKKLPTIDSNLIQFTGLQKAKCEDFQDITSAAEKREVMRSKQKSPKKVRGTLLTHSRKKKNLTIVIEKNAKSNGTSILRSGKKLHINPEVLKKILSHLTGVQTKDIKSSTLLGDIIKDKFQMFSFVILVENSFCILMPTELREVESIYVLLSKRTLKEFNNEFLIPTIKESGWFL
ncbi:MAG: hypothetical protein KDD56_03690 [Bdellovibrionales bacterium]|nr:hypothetical protein [Bdellovibrionales bacterium]